MGRSAGVPSGACLSISLGCWERGVGRAMAKARDKVGTCWNRPVPGKQREARNNGPVF